MPGSSTHEASGPARVWQVLTVGMVTSIPSPSQPWMAPVLPRRGGSRPAQYLASIGPGLGSLLKEICQVILQTDHTLRLHTQRARRFTPSRIQMFTFLDMNATSTSLPPPLAQKA